MSLLRSSLLRAGPRLQLVAPTTPTTVPRPSAVVAVAAAVRARHNSSYAVSNVTLADIEKRWELMPPNEQAELWMQLRDRMKGSWSELTAQEKKACWSLPLSPHHGALVRLTELEAYWIAFGPHGPRARPPPGENTKVLTYTLLALAGSFVTFYLIRVAGRPAPKTMTKEWQEASNEYLKAQKVEPITGVSSEDYKGPGMVQSK